MTEHRVTNRIRRKEEMPTSKGHKWPTPHLQAPLHKQKRPRKIFDKKGIQSGKKLESVQEINRSKTQKESWEILISARESDCLMGFGKCKEDIIAQLSALNKGKCHMRSIRIGARRTYGSRPVEFWAMAKTGSNKYVEHTHNRFSCEKSFPSEYLTWKYGFHKKFSLSFN